MTKSKTFWAAAAFVSLAVMVFAGWSIYERMALHFSGDTIEVRPVPMPPPQEEDLSAQNKEGQEELAAKEAKADQEEEAKSGKAAAAAAAKAGGKKAAAPAAKPEEDKVKAVKTAFEYKDAGAKSVSLAGSFSSWKEKKMTKKGGVWRTDVYILPGTYPYHFTVDGKKKLDPGKPKAPTGDSLLTVE